MAKQIKVKKEQVDKVEAEYIPDIPAQMESNYKDSIELDMTEFKEFENSNPNEKSFIIDKTVSHEIRVEKDGLFPIIVEKPDSNEILFLRHILHRQHSGGFGKHLDDEINERIKQLKSCL